MRDYEFTLRYLLLSGLAAQTVEQRLFEGGCADALLGLGQKGRLTLAFTRPAESAQAAVLGALRDVAVALPECRLMEVGPDWVGMTELTLLLDYNAQTLLEMIRRHAATFPLQLHGGQTGLWHLADVLTWLAEHQGRTVDEPLREVTMFNRTFNVAKDFRSLDAAQRKQMMGLAGVEPMGPMASAESWPAEK